MSYKRYSAFISSNFQSLTKERNIVINCLLDAQMLPICMEHFTATSNQNFSYIKNLIDQSDIFIMILGKSYGSTDINGVSWTENEYIYAKQTNKTCYVLKTEEYQTLRKQKYNGEQLTKEELKQLEFGENLPFCQEITAERTISRIMQNITTSDFTNCTGWERESQIDKEEWERTHRYLDLSGKWYHVHLKDEDSSYIRIGTVDIKQTFNSKEYKHLHFSAANYDVLNYDAESCEIEHNRLRKTVWSGDYFIDDDNSIWGVYKARRGFNAVYGDWNIKKDDNKGIHSLNIVDDDGDGDPSDLTMRLEGSFEDVFPSPKNGLIYIFRSKAERNEFIIKHSGVVLRSE